MALAGKGIREVVQHECSLVTEGALLLRPEPERNEILVVAGIIAFRGGTLLLALKKIGNDNAQKQYYLTDAVAITNAAKQKVTAW